METKRKRFSLIGLILSLILAFELFFTADMLLSRASSGLSPIFAAIIFGAVLVGSLVLEAHSPKALSIVFLTVTALLIFALIFFGIVWYRLYSNVYPVSESDKGQIFANKRVMVIVPHEGDEQYMLSGVLEQYGNYGSQLWVVYVTDEELDYSLATLGVDATHLLQLSPDKELSQNLLSLILRISPDIIFCPDSNGGAEYQSLSDSFDQTMRQTLTQKSGYTPAVFKSVVHSDYAAPESFYRENISSVRYSGETDYLPENGAYNWSERLRLPVYSGDLSRSVYSCNSYQRLSRYNSEALQDNIISGDRVFWQRETSSMSYALEYWVSSGDGELLNDFSLTSGTWIPDRDDSEKRIIIKFPDSAKIARVVLYDNPSLTDNVQEAALRFDDGSFVMTGALEPNGSATEVEVNKIGVSELEIVLMNTEGSAAGLTELELYSDSYNAPFKFIKLVNSQGDFVYDYYIDSSGVEEFGLYAFGCSDNIADYRVICIGEDCYASVVGDKLIMHCPEGKSCTLTIMDSTGELSDTVYIQNKKTTFIDIGQRLEYYMRNEFKWGENSNTAILVDKLSTHFKGDS
jgi:hypothetical protein